MQIELLWDGHAVIGESPLYDPDTQTLCFADIKKKTLNRLDLSGRNHLSWSLPDDLGAFALTPEADGAVVALRSGLFHLEIATGALDRIVDAPFDPNLMRFNEGACSPEGRFYVGVMFDPRPGVEAERISAPMHSLRLGEPLRPEPDVSDLHNGMAFSPEGSIFYLSHTHERRIFAFDREPQTGRLSNRRIFAEIEPGPGSPDGAAVDALGGYWCALHKGWEIRRYRPDGGLDRRVALPVSQPTMCAFAGPNLERLVVSSAAQKLSPVELQAQPHAGGLFALRPDVRGVPRRARIAAA